MKSETATVFYSFYQSPSAKGVRDAFKRLDYSVNCSVLNLRFHEDRLFKAEGTRKVAEPSTAKVERILH